MTRREPSLRYQDPSAPEPSVGPRLPAPIAEEASSQSGPTPLFAAGSAPSVTIGHVSSVDPWLTIPVYDIEVEGEPEFFANGILVHNSVWGDEFAGMGANAKPTYDQMMFGLRLKGPHGEQPRAMLSTTPKPLLLFRQLNDRFLRGDPAVVVTRASMMDNSANLSSELIREIRSSYEGTRFGEQEIYGKLLLDIPGALWTADSFSPCTMPSLHELDRIVVAIDPSGAADKNSSSDEIGIVVAGVRYGGNRGEDRFVVLKDSTMIGSPREWAIEAVREYHDFAADRIVAEGNFGGAMVESTIKREDQNVPVRMVTASRGKAVRAEPVSALYEQGRVYHATAGENATGGGLAKLEEQLVQMTVTGYVGDGSPDRVDALVWAITDLMEARQAPVATPSSNASVSYWRPNL